MKTIIRASLVLGLLCSFADLANGGVVVAWGGDSLVVNSVPTGNDFVAIAAGSSPGYGFGLALRSDGSIAAWGEDYYGVVSQSLPGTGYTAIAASSHPSAPLAMALTPDGSVIGWGREPPGPVFPGPGYTAMAGGGPFAFGLRSDGSIAASMVPFFQPPPDIITPPGGNDFTAIAAGCYHGVALRSDGTIAAWGDDQFGQVSGAPTGAGFTAIAAGGMYSLALTNTGAAVGWGTPFVGPIDPIGAEFTAVATSGSYSLGLMQGGSIASWGPTNISCPTGGGFTAIAAGSCGPNPFHLSSYFGLAIRSTVPLPDAGEGDTAYVDDAVPGPSGDQTVDSAIIGDGGTLTMPGSGTLTANDGITVDQGGTLSGGGTINGDVDNNGTVNSDGGTINGDINNTGTLTSNGGEHNGDLNNSGTLTSNDGAHTGNTTNTGDIYSSGGTFSGDFVNYGTIIGSGGTHLSGTFINYGTIICTGGGSGGDGTFINYGTFTSFGGEEFPSMDNQGTFDLGQGAFTTEFDGDFSQSADGSMLAEIGGHIQGDEFDFVHVTGSASLEGYIDVSLIDGFSPNLGDAFTIMTADMGISVGGAGLSIVGDGCFSWRIADGGTSLQLVSVPEPAAFTLLAIGAVLFAGFWRFRS